MIGISLAFSAILIPQVEGPNGDLKLTPTQSSWVASVIVLAVPVGCLFAGVLMEWIGRLNAIKLSAIPCVIGWILIARAESIYELLAGRILTGLGSAIGTSPAIVYITEVARPDLRGSLISTAPTLASLGKHTRFWLQFIREFVFDYNKFVDQKRKSNNLYVIGMMVVN